VKYILKGGSPEEFENWKKKANDEWQPSWNDFQNPEKEKVKEALLIEQGYLCCYCGMRIENNSYTEIEHIKPRKECIGDEEYRALDFQNFLASCNGSTKEPKPREVHCNNARGDKALLITPLNQECETKFLYIDGGKVLSENPDDREMDILINRVLMLNAKKIKGARESIIKALESDFNGATINDIEEEILALSQKENNQFKEMCFVSAHYLQNNFL